MKSINWHRLFGLLLIDYLSPRGFRVELEKDLSVKRQLLDVVVVERIEGTADMTSICDGFDNFGKHNLITFKSKQESLNAFAIEELIGHYVNYRKILKLKTEEAQNIRLYGVSAQYPKKLFATVKAESLCQGVYRFRPVQKEIRVIVLDELALSERNAVLAFFSFNQEKVKFALEHYPWQHDDGSTVINQLLEQYHLEGIDMPYTMDDFRRDYIRKHIGKLKPEERLKGLKPEERLKGLKPEERLKGLKPEERLKGLTFQEVEAYLKKLKKRLPARNVHESGKLVKQTS